MFSRSLLVLLGASGVFAASCSCFSTVTVSSSTTIYVPATTLLTIGSTAPPTTTGIVTITSATTSTIASTSYTGSAATSYIFLPGSPPAKRDLELEARAVCNADNCLRTLRLTKVLSSAQAFCSSYTTRINTGGPFPSYVPSECNASRVSSACSCLPTASSTSCSTSTSTQIITISVPFTVTRTTTDIIQASTTSTSTLLTTAFTTTILTLPLPAITSTIYPCANPINFQGPTYGDYSSPSSLGLSNSLYYLSTPQGGSAVECCNTCFFNIANCVQAYWYSYEGCVVSQATDLSSGTGENVSGVCPAGVFAGLSYGPDTNPAFRSTGNIAGPCGQVYSNL